ncbi:hypothetical protein G4B88_006089 [Cannabis sativa]|uniref:Pentatricopeptide repeat-containing protein n=1 Tax=Cannabis sativa TaxID=3483 RepID=A0A7J6IAT3_CANSA|nr:hypothetical protein G4B88_006089 [Cannabis sativa]
MVNRGTRPDNFTCPIVLKGCGKKMDIVFRREVHMSIEHRSLKWSLFVHNALVAMYGKFGLIDIARHLFDKMPERDAVSWNAMISVYASRGIMWMESNEVNVITWNTIAGGCVRTGNFMGAVKFLSQMRGSGNFLDLVGLIIGLNACSHMGAVMLGKEVRSFAVTNGIYEREDLMHAYTIFQLIEDKHIITWNSLIYGYTHIDRAEEASFLFREMMLSRLEPNYITIASIPPLCVRVGNLQHGKEFHCYIIKWKEFGNYLLLVECNCGDVCKVRQDYRIHGNAAILIVNMYVVAGNRNMLAEVRVFMRDLGVRKSPERAWVDAGNRFCPFLVRDMSKSNIYIVSDGLI